MISTPVRIRSKVSSRRLVKANVPGSGIISAKSTMVAPQQNKSILEQPLEKFLCSWLESRRGLIKATTYDTNERVILRYINPYVGNVPMGEVTPEQIQSLLGQLKDIGGYSYSTVKKVHDILGAAYTKAIKHREIKVNPMDLVEMPSKELWGVKEMSFFTAEECKKIIWESGRVCNNGKPVYVYGYALQLILLTGVRVGELIGFKKTDYDPITKVLRVRRNICRVRNRDAQGKLMPGSTIKEAAPKSKAGCRNIPLTDRAVEIIEALCAQFPDSEWLVNNSRGEQAKAEQLDRTFARLLKNLGMERAGVHKLRHTFASILFQGGTDLKSISKLLGHADARITLQTYIHIADTPPHSALSPISELGRCA